MGLVDPDVFANEPVSAVYIAGRIAEARRVEAALSEQGIDYAVDVEPFQTLLLGIIPREYEGIAFYVLTKHAVLSRRALEEAGLTVGLVDDDSQ